MEQHPDVVPERPADSADSDEGLDEQNREHSEAAPAGEQEPESRPGVGEVFRSGS